VDYWEMVFSSFYVLTVKDLCSGGFMTSKLIITLEGPAKLESESFMQYLLDLIDQLHEWYNYGHAGKIGLGYHFNKESGRVEE
jgi:hypothetical protein